ncbi:MAG TPA: esterase-like activity of phytase family protein [Polyangiaceae bacterium]|nr:esterase-like activity of phytase family protein [Polyangiaceae bacterium]
MSRWTERLATLGTRRVLGPAAACAGLLACAAAIAPLTVPPSLDRATPLELSGITWSRAIARYVVVSDDAVAGGEKHAPLLFSIGLDGHMDATPITIDGVGELNDLESITEATDGTLFVATSHSLNKHGHLPSSRRRLLHLKLTPDRHAHELGEIDLTTARTAGGELPWGSGLLDVEALAFRDGALYIGLKSPLASDGATTILRIAAAESVVDSGTLHPGAAEIWAHPRFAVSHAGATVHEGISDLSFRPDGRLLVVANSPKGMPSDGGGALWQLDVKGATPRLIERFEGLKPEGVTVSPDRGALVIVFDRDGEKPVWTKRPLPP